MNELILRTSYNEYEFELIHKEKSKFFRRDPSEKTDKFLQKLTTQLRKILKLKKSTEITANFQFKDTVLDSSLPLYACLDNNKYPLEHVSLLVFENKKEIIEFPILYNLPTIDSAELNTNALNFPPMVSVKIFCTVSSRYCDKLTYKWYRVKARDSSQAEIVQDSDCNFYKPTLTDENHYLICRVVCGLAEKTVYSNFKIIEHESIESRFPFDDRAELLKNYNCSDFSFQSNFRMMTYNILFCEDARDAWSQVSDEHLSLKYRLPILTEEILAYNSDIIALQEVTTKVFQEWLVPNLNEKYTGVLAKRNESNSVALFYNKNRYDLIRSFDCNLEHIPACATVDDLKYEFGIEFDKTMDNNEIDYKEFEDFYLANFPKMEKEYPVLFKELCTPRTVVQVVTLYDNIDKNYLVIANTHLTGNHRKYGHVRPFQGKVLADCILTAELDLKRKYLFNPNAKIGKFVVGDLNCQPHYPTAKLLTKTKSYPKCPPKIVPSLWFNTHKSILERFGRIRENDDLQEMSDYERKLMRESIDLEKIEQDDYANWLKTDLALTNSLDCDDVTVTSFTKYYQQVIDYIFYDDEVVLQKYILPTPKMDILKEEVCLPSSKFPSDHLAQVVDFSWL